MTRKRDRVFAFVGALVFFISGCGIWLAVYTQMHNDNNSANATGSSSVNNSNKLAGTQLQNFTPVAHIDSLQTVDTTAGTGQEVKAGDTVTVDYTGAVAANGTIFQSSKDTGQTVSFPLSNVIQGWQNGIPGMKVGGTRRLLIPAAQAYGATPPQGSGIPANADLVFDVTLHKIGQ